ncbi:MAG: hypothetical protein ACRDRS_15485 [Pseudonocardiaceae bacterium]
MIELRHLDDFVGGGDLFPVVSKELSEVREVVQSASYTDEIGQRLLTVVGELAQLAGWVASDAGRCVEAQRIYLDGVSAARVAADRTLAAQLLSSLSYQLANGGNPDDGALLARSAVKGAGDASPLVRALLWERVAWASARSRDHSGARRALAVVDDAYEDRSPGVAEPEWVYWLDRREIDVMAGRCLIELAIHIQRHHCWLGPSTRTMPITPGKWRYTCRGLRRRTRERAFLMRHMTRSPEFVESREE